MAKSTQVDNLKLLKEKLQSKDKHDLAYRVADKERRRVIEQFKEDFEDWVNINTIVDENACNLVKTKANKYKKLYDTINNVSLVTGPNPTGYEVGSGAKAAGTPRWYVHRYVFSITHDIYLSEGDSVDVHHLDGNPKNNSPRNLLALPNHIHKMYEHGKYAELNELVNELVQAAGKGKEGQSMYKYVLAEYLDSQTGNRSVFLGITSIFGVRDHKDILLDIVQTKNQQVTKFTVSSAGFINKDIATGEFIVEGDSETLGEKTNEKDKKTILNFLKGENPGLCSGYTNVYEDTVVD